MEIVTIIFNILFNILLLKLADALYVILKREIFKLPEGMYERVTREVTRLEALLEDYKTVESSVKQTQERATQFWDSRLGVTGISLQLDESQTSWLSRVENLGGKAKLLIEDYDKLKLQRRQRIVNIFSLLQYFQQTCVVAFKMKQALKEINKYSKNKQVVKLIVKSLELSKSKVRRLQDGPIDEKNRESISLQPWFRSGAALVPIFRGLIAQKPNLMRGLEEQVASIDMQLMLLSAFMKDLRGLRLESAMENTWAREAKEIISATEIKINSMLWPNARSSLFGDWAARRVLKREMERLSCQLLDLLEAKSNYGFEFSRRVASRFTHASPLPTDFYDSSILTDIRSEQIKEGSKQVIKHREAMGEILERINLLLRETRVSQYASLTQMMCRRQLQGLASEARVSSATYVQGLCLWLPFKRRCRSRYLVETLGIVKQLKLLEMSILAYTIKIVEDSSSFLALEEDVYAMISQLTTQSVQRWSVFCIAGIHGIGKTALTKKIYNNTSVMNSVNFRHWFSLPNDIEELLHFLKNEDGLLTPANSYLLVFDNLESKESWDELYGLLHAVETRAVIKIVITTRKTTVASYVNPTSIHQIRLRTKDEAWEFFTQMIPMTSETATTDAEGTVSEEVEALARKLVAKTSGLPLAILYLGYRFTVNKLTTDNLTRELQRVTLGQNQSMWFDAHDLNKDDLESKPILGQFLSYFESFPVDFVMPVRRLVSVLAAQGLVKSESTAYEHLLELIDRNMIQVVERHLNGKVKTCQFPSDLREWWQRHRHEMTPIRSWYFISTGLKRQITYHFADTDANSSHRIPSLCSSSPSFLYEERFPSSIMFFDSREGSQPGDDISKFLYRGTKSGQFRGLLVLDLEGVYRPKLPKNIGDLKKLKYLGLRCTDLEIIPTSIKKLLSLQTLDVKHTSIKTLPMSVWKLTKLRHLYLNRRCRVECTPRLTNISMDDLVTLSGAFLNENSPLKEGLANLTNLRKLRLAFHLSGPQQQVLEESIVTLTNLISLSLSSIKGQRLEFSSLEPLIHLSSLYLFGKLKHERFCITEKLPKGLTKLILSASQLTADAMRSLASLEELKSLYFFSGSYQESNMIFPRQAFPRLLVLKLWRLDPLQVITIEEGAMISLWKLEIRLCKELTSVSGLTRLDTLHELKLINMPADFARRVEIDYKQVSLNIIPKIRIHNSS